MRTIWKVELNMPSKGETEAWLPGPYDHAGVGIQRDTMMAWVMVDTSRPPGKLRFKVTGIGWENPDEGEFKHIGTVLTQPNGAFVWHIWCTRYVEQGPPPTS